MVYSMLVIPAKRQKGDHTLKVILGYITNSMPTQGNKMKSCPQNKTKQKTLDSAAKDSSRARFPNQHCFCTRKKGRKKYTYIYTHIILAD